MKYKVLDLIVLKHDMPEHKLCAGDLGTIVEVYESKGFEVEFVKASGETLTVVTLSEDKVRPVESADIVSVRSLSYAS
jgi:hypothetical protein